MGEAMIMRESIMYCQKYETTQYNNSMGDYWYTHFMSHPEVCRLFDESHEVYKVIVRELKKGEESIYWGWWENKTNQFEHVHPTKGILSMVFPYAMELYEKEGKGKALNVIIEELKIMEKEVK